jgi:hypothetical protein
VLVIIHILVKLNSEFLTFRGFIWLTALKYSTSVWYYVSEDESVCHYCAGYWWVSRMGLEGNEDFIEYSIEILIAVLILLFTIVTCLRLICLYRKLKFGIDRVWESIS